MAVVVRVVDGDTVILRTDGRRERVRLIGVDAPETWLRHDCFGEQATEALRHLTPPGSRVGTTPDTERHDRFGRLLLYLWTPRGDFVNEELIHNGFARTMTLPPNTSHAPTLQEAEHAAQHTRAGLWHACP
jgi:micrococcal nuclease